MVILQPDVVQVLFFTYFFIISTSLVPFDIIYFYSFIISIQKMERREKYSDARHLPLDMAFFHRYSLRPS